MEITIDAVGEARAGAVWERYMDPRQWSSWATQIVSVEYSMSRVCTQSFGRLEGPLWLRLDFEVTDVDEAGWTWTSKVWFKNRKLGLTLTHGVASRPDGSRTWLTLDGPPAFVLPYLPYARCAIGRLVRR
ncbi:MarR family transcriptional regulator [Rhodococcus sp. RS1C4]|uniref:MarR family transcriptional regulator n=1 Tax=Nocardiaceae TaxID=85025 RepID=UPI0005230E5E|nr:MULTISPECIES: MarR family transcriptional regulator [Rhodococcus]OZC52342.1 MarR family transcriptional regulator [Rhodococcus sp. 06-621-2]OZC55970.1 MarR family transcriptional regulator [Rhodococcus sp. RS1C4]OZD08412.1 MarR family transcriptional regulator [Rhodococcus sp. 06-156-4C]OZD12919.1 MarR family transcriptional regulator [Rhodococcus sp. 06-156-3C]OZD23357.1 MarR family transcriptional regulator [Rhodococcus sp. 06-156-4a]